MKLLFSICWANYYNNYYITSLRARATLRWNPALPVMPPLPSRSPTYHAPSRDVQTSFLEEGVYVISPLPSRFPTYPAPTRRGQTGFQEEGGCHVSPTLPAPYLPRLHPGRTNKKDPLWFYNHRRFGRKEHQRSDLHLHTWVQVETGASSFKNKSASISL